MRGSTSRGQSTGSWVLLMVETIECSSVEWQCVGAATGLDGLKSQCELVLVVGWFGLPVLLTGLASWFQVGLKV